MKNIFFWILGESENRFSHRKIISFTAVMLFSCAVIGYLVVNNFRELPSSYMILLSMVFTFYFAKKTIENISFRKNDSAKG